MADETDDQKLDRRDMLKTSMGLMLGSVLPVGPVSTASGAVLTGEMASHLNFLYFFLHADKLMPALATGLANANPGSHALNAIANETAQKSAQRIMADATAPAEIHALAAQIEKFATKTVTTYEQLHGAPLPQGLLKEMMQEREAISQAFHQAVPGIEQQVIRMQNRITSEAKSGASKRKGERQRLQKESGKPEPKAEHHPPVTTPDEKPAEPHVALLSSDTEQVMEDIRSITGPEGKTGREPFTERLLTEQQTILPRGHS